MPVWSVQVAGGDETIEAGLLATEGGALVALSPEGLVVRAWAPGHWEGVTCLVGLEDLEASEPNVCDEVEPVVFGLPTR